ncbi:hypothetical protein WDU94_011882 [Cyamophila willieti]
MERYLAICHPLLSYAMSGLRRAIRIIAGLWLLAFLCATPFAMYTTVNYLDFPHVAVVSTFFLCWAPFHTQRLIFLYGQQVEYFQSINEWLFLYSGVFYYVSSTVNPILYNVMSVKYRQAFKQTLCCRGSRSHLGFARDQSSFRETMVDVASPQWTRAMTWKRTPSKRPNNVSSNTGKPIELFSIKPTSVAGC